jgi:D-3-phosphoglycerate dehydrogenase
LIVPKKILLTTTSFQDTPGEHLDVLAKSGLIVVPARGPLSEAAMLDLIKSQGPFDGFLNGDDRITAAVIDAALPSLRVIAKYGIGLDSIDVNYATSKKIPVLFTPGANHTTVAEHAIGLIIAVAKSLWFHMRSVKNGKWDRKTGNEMWGKTLGVIGVGRIGKEIIIRANAFGMTCIGYDLYWDQAFADANKVRRCDSRDDVLRQADVVSLHPNLTPETRHMINRDTLALMKKGAILINTARGGLVDEKAVAEACRSGKLLGYGTDVMDEEPIKPPHPFLEIDNIIVTPHVGSRTHESVQRQGLRAARNLVNFLSGNSDYIQANKF